MGKIRPDTQPGRILKLLVDGRWHGGPDEFGNDFHVASQRIGAELKSAGFRCESRRRKGKPWYEYRLIDFDTILRARAVVAGWRGEQLPPLELERLEAYAA